MKKWDQILVETPLGNLSEFMRHFNISYTWYFNHRHKRVGHLFQGRYKSILVEKDTYLSILSRYIHLNPIRVQTFKEISRTEKVEHLHRYPWSSLPGYLDPGTRDEMVNCSLVLEDFGGDARKGRETYWNQLLADLDEDLDVKSEIFGQSIIGGESFLCWVKETFLSKGATGERPTLGKIKRYRQKETILALIKEETGKDLEALKGEKGKLRRLAMDLLFRHGGFRGPEIGALFGIGYSAVSQERKRLWKNGGKNPALEKLMRRLEEKLSTMKI